MNDYISKLVGIITDKFPMRFREGQKQKFINFAKDEIGKYYKTIDTEKFYYMHIFKQKNI